MKSVADQLAIEGHVADQLAIEGSTVKLSYDPKLLAR
jgi:hypothetical protein